MDFWQLSVFFSFLLLLELTSDEMNAYVHVLLAKA